MTIKTIVATPVRRSVIVKADPTRAFQDFVVNIGRWWPRGACDRRQAVADVPEPPAGGRWYGVSEDGSTCEWGKVLAYDPPERLLLAWWIDAAWKCNPDFVIEVDVLFKAEGGGTRAELGHRNLERFDVKAATVWRTWSARMAAGRSSSGSTPKASESDPIAR